MQPDLDEVDPGQRDRQVAGDHHAGAEQPVEEVDQRDGLQRLAAGGLRERGVRPGHCGSSEAKVYGGQGPPTSSRTRGCSDASRATRSLNAATPEASTR